MCLALTVFSCNGADPAGNKAGVASDVNGPAAIIERAISAHGMEGMHAIEMQFMFRDRQYSILTDHGKYRFSRNFTDSLGRHIEDVITNEGLLRTVDGRPVKLTEKEIAAFTGSVNSVRYFFMLPYGLDEPAVEARYLAETTIKESNLARLEVTFDSKGGGTDHEDVYHYFFNRQTGELDYLAYSFDVNDGGIRFREAVNKRRVGGVLVQDYKNYGIDGEDRNLSDIDKRFASGELPLLSTIENTEISVVHQTGGQ